MLRTSSYRSENTSVIMKLVPILLTVHTIAEVLKMIFKYGGRISLCDSYTCINLFFFNSGNSRRDATFFATFAVTQYENRYKSWKLKNVISKVSTLIICVENIWRYERPRDKGQREKKVGFGAFLLGMPGETPLIVGERCSYAGRETALWKYSMNSRSKQSKWKLLYFIKSD